MGAQDRTEKVLRDMHVLFSKAEPFENSKKKVVVDKEAMMSLLKELNDCMYDMMDEHELTVKSRDKANRQMQKQGDDIIFDASRRAEDIYAASIMYTDNAINNIQDIIKDSTKEFEKIYEEAQEKVKKQEQDLKTNQIELKALLNDLIDTQKYLHLIEEENLRLKEEKESPEEVDFDKPVYDKPEIHINTEYFKNAGLLSEEESEQLEQKEALEDIGVTGEDLDSEYFQWQEDQKEKTEKKGIKGIFTHKG